MSCPFSSASYTPRAGQVCPVTGKGAYDSEEAEDGSLPYGCYISRTGGLDFNVYNRLDNGSKIPLTNIPTFLTLSNLKDLLKASAAVKVPAQKSWNEIVFSKYDNLTPLREDQSLAALGVKSGDNLDMIDSYEQAIKPLFIKVTLPGGSDIGLNYVPPWTTFAQLRKILTAHTTVPLDEHQCFVAKNNYAVHADNGGICIDNNTRVNGGCADVLLDDEVHLGSLGNLLEIGLMPKSSQCN